jgi:hypothetical protein
LHPTTGPLTSTPAVLTQPFQNPLPGYVDPITRLNLIVRRRVAKLDDIGVTNGEHVSAAVGCGRPAQDNILLRRSFGQAACRHDRIEYRLAAVNRKHAWRVQFTEYIVDLTIATNDPDGEPERVFPLLFGVDQVFYLSLDLISRLSRDHGAAICAQIDSSIRQNRLVARKAKGSVEGSGLDEDCVARLDDKRGVQLLGELARPRGWDRGRIPNCLRVGE